MSRIIVAIKAKWVIVGMLFIISEWLIAKTAGGIISGKRRFAILSVKSRASQLIKYGLFLSMAAGLLWASMQDYLFITSVFPVAAFWLRYSIWLFAVVLLFSGLLDKEKYR